MHHFCELVEISTNFNLMAIDKVQKEALKNLEVSAKTSDIKALQIVELQKVILCVGMFSIFESILQSTLKCDNGFKKALEILKNQKNLELKESFNDLYLAINVLKHGKRRSYDILLAKIDTLKFQLKKPNELFFDEDDVSEVDTLIKVDNEFVLLCSSIIYEVYKSVII